MTPILTTPAHKETNSEHCRSNAPPEPSDRVVTLAPDYIVIRGFSLSAMRVDSSRSGILQSVLLL